MSTISLQRDQSAVTSKKEGPPVQGVVQRGLESLGNFAADTAGDIAILFGLMAMVMFILIGAAVDMGRWLNARDQTLAAIDAAVLAAGRALQTNGGDVTKAIDVAKAYYAQNTKTRLPVSNDTVNFAVVDGGGSVEAKGSARIKTPFIGLIDPVGHKFATLPLLNLDDSESAKAKIATNRNSENNLEISMMLDTSGSMDEYTSSGNKKYIDMRAAAKDLVDIVVWADQSTYTSKIGLVPFSGDVRLPASMFNNVTDAALPAQRCIKSGAVVNCNTNNSVLYKKTACVAERTGTNKYTDVGPGAGNFVMANYTTNAVCEQDKTTDEVLPMTSDKNVLKAKIDTLTPQGYTAGEVGTAWAWYLLSPNWATVLPAASQPVAYGTPKTKKIAILMTDGEYNSTHDVNGVKNGLSQSGANANGDSSPVQAKSLCTGMKAKGIEVYTVGFNVGGNATAVDTLSNCATDASHFYNATNGEQIKQAFRDIALKSVKLYLSK